MDLGSRMSWLLSEGVPFENRIRLVTCELVRSGGTRVLVDQAAQDGSSADPFAVEVGNGDTVTVVFTVGDALGDALVRPGCVVVRLILGQHGPQMRFTENEHAVEELSAQGTDQALADRVAPHRQLHLIRTIGTDVSG